MTPAQAAALLKRIQEMGGALPPAKPVVPGPKYLVKDARHEISAARKNMSAETSELFQNKALAYRLGKGTLAGALNDSVRFRVTGDGPIENRKLVPDSPTAAALMQGKEGAALSGQLKTAMQSMSGFENASNLKGFILPKDVDGVIAGMMVRGLEEANPQMQVLHDAMANNKHREVQNVRPFVGQARNFVNNRYKEGVAAWNGDGWITFRPDIARKMLTSVGAYTPPKGSPQRKAAIAADQVNHVPTHEVQHSISPTSRAFYSSPAKWMEEAVSEVLSNTPAIQNRVERKTGVTPQSYAGRLAHPSEVDLGWNGWERPKPSAAQQKKNEQEVSRNYLRSQDVMRDLLRLGGMKFNSNDGITEVRKFLQGAPVESLSERLAMVITEKHGLGPDKVNPLARRIASIVDDKGGLTKLKKDFGLK